MFSGRRGETLVKSPGAIDGQQFIIEDCEDCDIWLLDWYAAAISIPCLCRCIELYLYIDSAVSRYVTLYPILHVHIPLYLAISHGLYTILWLPVLYGVLHTHGRSKGESCTVQQSCNSIAIDGQQFIIEDCEDCDIWLLDWYAASNLTPPSGIRPRVYCAIYPVRSLQLLHPPLPNSHPPAWPSHDIVITNTVWCIANTGGRKGSLVLSNNRATVLLQDAMQVGGGGGGGGGGERMVDSCTMSDTQVGFCFSV